MSKDEKNDGKEFTFIREQILPKKKSKLKKIFVSLGATVVLAVLFGIIARIAFIVSEPVINRILGIDTNKKQVTFASGDENNNPNGQEQSAAVSLRDEDTQEDDDTEAVGTDSEQQDSENEPSVSVEPEEEAVSEESTTVNNTYYVEKKISASITDFITMYSDLKKVASQAFTSIVTVTCTEEAVDVLNNPYEKQTDTPGLIVANNGVEFLLLVSYEQVKDASYLEATFTGNICVEAKLQEYDENTGLAVLSVELEKLSNYVIDETAVANLGESYLLTNGTPVLAVGAPNGISNSFDFGIVTNCTGVVYVTDLKLDLFYTSIVTSQDGLGYIVNLDGAIVGIISNHFNEDSSQNICTVIGISRVKKLIEKMVNDKERVYLGIVAEDMPVDALTDAGISYGIYVTEVVAESPAYEAGIQNGDIIVSIDESPVGGVNSYVSILDTLSYKSEVTIGVVRFNNGTSKEIELPLTVGRVKK